MSPPTLQGALDDLLAGGLLAYATNARPNDVLIVVSVTASEALAGTRWA